MIKRLPSSTVRNGMRDIIDYLYANSGAVIIERNDKPMAVLISYEDFLRVESFLTKPEPSPAH